MLAPTLRLKSFPSVRLALSREAQPVEVSLIAQLGHGAGDALFRDASIRQRAHSRFVDALDEPSAKLAGIDLSHGDVSSLYSFSVGPQGHPFHRHAGHRIFTAVSGSGGAQLRFSCLPVEQLRIDPSAFVPSLRFVNIPPDCLFTLRFGAEIWHQFAPLDAGSLHPVLFALSCHTNELGGALPEALRKRVAANDATIPALTELLPVDAARLLDDPSFNPQRVPTAALSFDAPAGSWHSSACAAVRGVLGRTRAWLNSRRSPQGFRSTNAFVLVKHTALPKDSLLQNELTGADYEDSIELRRPLIAVSALGATGWLACLLEGFLENRPSGVSTLMQLRNLLVKPVGLRTSPVGCPASSLLAKSSAQLFAGRYPVLEQWVDSTNQTAQVILGADDKHLQFRSCIGVDLSEPGHVSFTLSTRVRCKNLFGRLYMASIHSIHHHYVAPAMLQAAAVHAAKSIPAE